MRHYDGDKVRNYMLKKQAERRKKEMEERQAAKEAEEKKRKLLQVRLCKIKLKPGKIR